MNGVVLEANLSAPVLLVVAEIFYPGWKCFVDGREAKIYRANCVRRGIMMPAGSHRVEFRFEPLSFRIGALISSAAPVVVAAWSMLASFKRSGA